MIIVVDFDNDQIRFGPGDTDSEDLRDLPKPRTMREVRQLLEEVLTQLYNEDAKSVRLDFQDDGRVRTVDEWAL